MIAKVENKEETKQISGKEPLKGKREKFAQLVATNTKNNTEAARGAGYKEHKGLIRYAYELAINPVIKARIACIRAELAKKFDITKESQVKQYWDVVAVCDSTGDMANKNKALNSIDKLFGLSIDKTEHTDDYKARQAMSAEQQASFDRWVAHELEQSIKPAPVVV